MSYLARRWLILLLLLLLAGGLIWSLPRGHPPAASPEIAPLQAEVTVPGSSAGLPPPSVTPGETPAAPPAPPAAPAPEPKPAPAPAPKSGADLPRGDSVVETPEEPEALAEPEQPAEPQTVTTPPVVPQQPVEPQTVSTPPVAPQQPVEPQTVTTPPVAPQQPVEPQATTAPVMTAPAEPAGTGATVGPPPQARDPLAASWVKVTANTRQNEIALNQGLPGLEMSVARDRLKPGDDTVTVTLRNKEPDALIPPRPLLAARLQVLDPQQKDWVDTGKLMYFPAPVIRMGSGEEMSLDLDLPEEPGTYRFVIRIRPDQSIFSAEFTVGS